MFLITKLNTASTWTAFSSSQWIKLDNTLCRAEKSTMSYREGAERFYDLFGAKDDALFYIELAHVPELTADGGWFVQKKPLDESRLVVRTGYHSTDVERRIMSVSLWYDIVEDGRIVERYYDGSDVYIHSAEGVRSLLDEAGYEVLEWYGDLRKDEFTEESEMMVILAGPA